MKFGGEANQVPHVNNANFLIVIQDDLYTCHKILSELETQVEPRSQTTKKR